MDASILAALGSFKVEEDAVVVGSGLTADVAELECDGEGVTRPYVVRGELCIDQFGLEWRSRWLGAGRGGGFA